MGELGITIITPTKRLNCMTNLIDNFYRQEYGAKELVIVINNNQMSINQFETYALKDSRIRVFQLDESKTLSECLNFAIEQANYAYISRFDDDDYYGEHYLCEVDETFRKTGCSIVNKASIYCYFKENAMLIQRFSDSEGMPGRMTGGAVLSLIKDIYPSVSFKPMGYGEDTAFLAECQEKGYLICSSSKKHFVAIREADVNRHTFKLSMDRYLRHPTTRIIAEKISLEDACKFVSLFEKEDVAT